MIGSRLHLSKNLEFCPKQFCLVDNCSNSKIKFHSSIIEMNYENFQEVLFHSVSVWIVFSGAYRSLLLWHFQKMPSEE